MRLIQNVRLEHTMPVHVYVPYYCILIIAVHRLQISVRENGEISEKQTVRQTDRQIGLHKRVCILILSHCRTASYY